jgi:hypothetical protein
MPTPLRPVRSRDLRPPARRRVSTDVKALDESSVRPDREHLALVNRHMSQVLDLSKKTPLTGRENALKAGVGMWRSRRMPVQR